MGNCIPNTSSQRSRLTRSGSREYRTHGYKHISGNYARKLVYADLDVIQGVLQARGTDAKDKWVKKGSKLHAYRYTFTFGKNFQIGQSPYSNQGRHLLPVEAFSGKYFNENELQLLGRVEYDVNNGENIIFLPSKARDVEFHRLPYHNGSHPKYTVAVIEDMSGIRGALGKAMDKDRKHEEWNPPEDLKEQLMDLQKKYWNMLVLSGPINVSEFDVRRARFRKRLDGEPESYKKRRIEKWGLAKSKKS
ncbi:AHH domain-containing protein [Melittangium boletus]|uniref:Uncharacterized protein n=1 Tax=Melittangium boletus DSM 14713 TaxID=1294270 RepID=A0A250I6K8_9BACT|nr:AHH domain-containing protein [Melittangium boletus]ATB26802.1 hypothetical protein MEBOL_000236 [Melittangium boletus DSM 14713]